MIIPNFLDYCGSQRVCCKMSDQICSSNKLLRCKDFLSNPSNDITSSINGHKMPNQCDGEVTKNKYGSLAFCENILRWQKARNYGSLAVDGNSWTMGKQIYVINNTLTFHGGIMGVSALWRSCLSAAGAEFREAKWGSPPHLTCIGGDAIHNLIAFCPFIWIISQ